DNLGKISLPDEAHLEAWSLYCDEARSVGAFQALARRFPQLLFPIRNGISLTEAYRSATRRGIWPDAEPDPSGLLLPEPGRVRLDIHRTIGGKIPTLIAPERSDFEDLVRAFSARNEPVAVPASMGACIVTGLNNWDRIHTYRRRWEAEHPFGD